MATQEDLDLENKNSLSNQRATRLRRDTARKMKDQMNAALRGATSTKERREIKNKFKVNTNKASKQTDNQMGANEDSNQRGEDRFTPTYNGVEGGGGLPDGYVETDVILCVNGSPVNGQFLFKEDAV